MFPDIGFVAGLDDAQLQRKLDQVGRKSVGTIGSINSALGPLRQSMGLIRGALGGFGLFAIGGMLVEQARASQQAVEKELAARREIAALVNQTIRDNVRATLPPEQQGLAAIYDKYDALIEKANETKREAQAMEELRVKVAKAAILVGTAIVQAFTGNEELRRERQQKIETADGAIRTYKSERDKETDRYKEQQKAAREAAEELAMLNHQRQLAATGAAELAARGDVFGSRRALEAIRAERERERIYELSKTNMPRALEQAEAENRLRRANRAAIDRDESDAKDNARLYSEQQRVEELRLRGHEREARALELLIAHERKLREIREAPGYTSQQRDALKEQEQEQELLRLRQKALGQTTIGDSFRFGRGNELGLSGGRRASNQTLGTMAPPLERVSREQVMEQRRANTMLAQMASDIRDLARRPNVAVFG